jgi:PAS domain-containing protein
MESLELWEIALIISISISSAMLVATGFWFVSNRGMRHQFVGADSVAPTFLFDGEDLRDATPDADLLIKNVPKHMSDRESVMHVFEGRFPKLGSIMGQLHQDEVRTLVATDNSAISLELTEIDGLLQIKIFGTCPQDGFTISEIAAQDASLRELSMLRNLTDKSPQLIWEQDVDGKLNWANAAYLELSDTLFDDQDKAVKSWPSEIIFPDLRQEMDEDTNCNRRVSVDIPTQKGEAWFDVTTVKNGANSLHFADCANSTVKAEYAKRKSVQTFGRIFAHLSTGLAIFDSNQRLTMFNPALMEMTSISPEFLSSRPTLHMFLDRLREARLLPEPKDYVKWRERFSVNGSDEKVTPYCENWEIADGQTFKVTGQPNRDNTFAFFFEDISAEVSLTRRFRSDIETGQGVLDALPDAIAVFSANGTLVMSNRSYGRLWNVDHETVVRNHDLRAEMTIWQRQCAAAPIWQELREFISRGGDRLTWSDRAVLDDGRQFTCKAQPISGGMTMISFVASSRIHPRIHQNLTRPDPSVYGMKG